MVDEDAREIHEVGCCRGCGESRESRLSPELAADRGEGVGEGGEGRALPSCSAKRGDGRELVMGEEGHACGQAEQGRCRTGDRALGPRALGRDAEGRADLAQRHFALPAQDKPGDELQRIGGQIGAQQGGCGELVARIADEHPANRDGRQAGVVPDRGARKPWEGSVARAVAARDGWGRPGRRGVVDVGRAVGEPSAHQARSACLPWTSRWGRRAQLGIQTQARDDGCRCAHRAEQFHGGVGAIPDDDQRPVWLPALHAPDQVARPARERLGAP